MSEIPIRVHVNFGPQNDPVRAIQPKPAFACWLIGRTIRNVIAKLEKKLLKEFCEIDKNVKIGIFGLILAYISVSRHDIGETKKKCLGLLAQGICLPSFVQSTQPFSLYIGNGGHNMMP